MAHGALPFGDWFVEESLLEFDRDILGRFGSDSVFFTVASEAEIKLFAVEEVFVLRVMGLVAGATLFIKIEASVF